MKTHKNYKTSLWLAFVLLFSAFYHACSDDLDDVEENPTRELSPEIQEAQNWYEHSYLQSEHAIYTQKNIYIEWHKGTKIDEQSLQFPCYIGENNSEEQVSMLKLTKFANGNYLGEIEQHSSLGGDSISMHYCLYRGLVNYHYTGKPDQENVFLSNYLQQQFLQNPRLKYWGLYYPWFTPPADDHDYSEDEGLSNDEILEKYLPKGSRILGFYRCPQNTPYLDNHMGECTSDVSVLLKCDSERSAPHEYLVIWYEKKHDN